MKTTSTQEYSIAKEKGKNKRKKKRRLRNVDHDMDGQATKINRRDMRTKERIYKMYMIGNGDDGDDDNALLQLYHQP